MAIVFTPTPKATDPPPDRANNPAHFQNVQTTTAANLNLINQMLRGWAQPVSVVTVGQALTSPTLNAWTDYPSALWPTASLVIPTGVGLVMVGLSAKLRCREADTTRSVQLSCRLTGTTFAVDRSQHRVYVVGGEVATAVQFVIPRANLTAGQTLNVIPQYNFTVPTAANSSMRDGYVWAVAMR